MGEPLGSEPGHPKRDIGWFMDTAKRKRKRRRKVGTKTD